MRRKFDPSATCEVITHTTSTPKKAEIAYPPSMVRIERDQQGADWVPSQNAAVPPAQQEIPNRKFVANNVGVQKPYQPSPQKLNGRGKGKQLEYRCPICDFDFPKGFTEVSANAHVNGHFNT